MHALVLYPSINTIFSLPHNLTDIDPINEVIKEIKSLELCKTFSYATITKKYSVIRTTLMRRHKGIIASRTTRISNTQKLNPQQEAELVKYIEGLTARQL
ncbi:hypothetical protein BU23DRAFT_650866 [Bimuria novae-zelandiae CBS 107.79]|uniref:HTH psq-type domain-containing protein n=1 Tax=Bimuria novae-zelandiae CBS 107.79 TaxID=1447943 RepID=A0A6A5V1D5_9PLEO|nr:hypothetical protein BU23DRAFT_650866 [Bimuria novae-zelandiae CBS 107.79]